MIEENLLEAVIGLPCNLFFGTGIPAAILLFNKGKQEIATLESQLATVRGKMAGHLKDLGL